MVKVNYRLTFDITDKVTSFDEPLTVKVTFTANETLGALPTATIAGNVATVTNVSGNTYRAGYLMQSGDSETASVAFAVNFRDIPGNAGTTVTGVTNGSAVTFDKTAPQLSSVTIASNNADPAKARVLDTVRVCFTSNEVLGALPTATILGRTAVAGLTVRNAGSGCAGPTTRPSAPGAI